MAASRGSSPLVRSGPFEERLGHRHAATLTCSASTEGSAGPDHSSGKPASRCGRPAPRSPRAWARSPSPIRAHDEAHWHGGEPHARRQGVRAPQAPRRGRRVRSPTTSRPPAQRSHSAALIAGNTGGVQTLRADPMVAEAMVKVWQEAGCPRACPTWCRGEVRDRQGAGGQSGHRRPLFTGSSCTGHFLHQQFAGQPARSWPRRWAATTR